MTEFSISGADGGGMGVATGIGGSLGTAFSEKIALLAKINAGFAVVAQKNPYLCDRLVIPQ